MANKFKMKHNRPALTLDELRGRIDKALRENRTQQALELARALFKQDSSPEHLELLKKATLERARQLRGNGYLRDASTVLNNASDLGGADFLKQVAEELAKCGEVRQSLQFLERFDDPALKARTIAQAVDSAMRQGPAGRNLLPENLREQFDQVRQAFAHAEAGHDEAARAALQNIGLQSPFLQWKLLVRGFLAYYQKDDARALENWQRLDNDRLPARLASPFRFLIDPGFRQVQPASTQTQLQKAADQFQSSPLAIQLRLVQSALVNEQQLPSAFRLAENLMPLLRQQAPLLAPRLACCFFWAIVSHGQPEDKGRYQRVFGAPADDPRLCRLEALALEQRDALEEASDAWQEFQEWLADKPVWGSAELRQRVRALIWAHMGELADAADDEEGEIPAFVRRLAGKSRSQSKLTPDACFKKSLELAPDRLETHQAMVNHYLHADQPAKAIKAGRELLRRFPKHAPTLEALGDLYFKKKEYDEAQKLLERALQVNPLEKRLRSKVCNNHLFHARELVQWRRYNEARVEYQAALSQDLHNQAPVLCKWAACEFKAGEPERAEELIQQARQGGHPLAITYYLLIEAARSRLPADLKARFNAEFTRVLAEPPTAEAAAMALDIAAAHVLAEIKYPAQKAHERTVLAYVESALLLDWTEEQLETICRELVALKKQKALKKFLQRGRMQYPASPVFHLLEAQNEMNKPRGRHWQISHVLDKAQRLADAMPRNDRQLNVLKEIHDLQARVRKASRLGPMGFLGDIMDRFYADEEF